MLSTRNGDDGCVREKKGRRKSGFNDAGRGRGGEKISGCQGHRASCLHVTIFTE